MTIALRASELALTIRAQYEIIEPYAKHWGKIFYTFWAIFAK
ncbi:MAG TPA: hypothetical protein VI413_12860 [Paludibacter sp.]